MPSMFPLTSAAEDLWFTTSQYTTALASMLSCSRASAGYAQTSTGTLTSFAVNTLRITDLGLLVEDARNNDALWSQDLTNAVWVKVNMTAVLDQTGPDGVANSATSLLATGANATVLQTITLGSAARSQSAWVKRLVGSGTINMTMDNGTTWTAITVTSDWTLATIPTQTLANPIVGFRIVTNGDKIAVDFVQNENGSFGTSPIPTTTGSVTRAEDLVRPIGNLLTLWGGLTTYSTVQDVIENTPAANITFWAGGILEDSGAKAMFRSAAINNTVTADYTGGGGNLTTGAFPTALWTTGVKTGYSQDGTGRSLVGNAGTVVTDANQMNFAPSGSIRIGLQSYQYWRRITVWNSRLANATLIQLTDPTSAFYQDVTTLFAQACL